MRVVIDASASVPGHKGLGRFQTLLVTELASRFPGMFEATVLLRPGSPLEDASLPPGWAKHFLEAGRGIVRSGIEIPRVLNRLEPEVFVTMADRLRAPGGVPVLLYVFEHPVYRSRMAKLSGAGRFDRAANLSNLAWFKATVRRADHVVAASSSTARDLFFTANVHPSKISVAMPGPFRTVPLGSAGRTPGILAFIDRDPRDNAAVVLEAFRRVPEPWKLHVVGDARGAAGDLVEGPGLAGRVVFYDRAPDEVVDRLYRECSILLEASLYEGFGAQTAEAMAAGLRCVVSSFTSLPEVVAGGSAVFVNPHDAGSVAGGLLQAVAAPDSDPPPPPDRWGSLCGHLVRCCQDLREAGAGRSG